MNTGLNGWLGRALKGLINRAAAIVDSYLSVTTMGISAEIGSFSLWASELGSGGSSFWNRTLSTVSNTERIDALNNDTRGDYEPTKSEMMLLENFSDKVASIIVDVVEEKSFILDQYNLTKRVDIQTNEMINALLQRIAIIKEFYKNNQNHSLSTQAIDLRNLMLEVLFNPIIVEVEKLGNYNLSFDLQNVVVEVLANTVVGETAPNNYTTTKKLTVNYFAYQKVVKDIIPIDQNYPIEIITQPIENPIEEIIEDSVLIPIDVDNTPVVPVNVEENTETEKKSTFPWVLLLAGFVGYKILK